jgi:hypothetical protein
VPGLQGGTTEGSTVNTTITHLSLQLADDRGLVWAQRTVSQHHYLHTPVDTRCSPVAYLVLLDGESVGCLIFGRPESTRTYGWYGSLEDTRRSQDDPKYCPLTRWQVVNLARVWLSPEIQHGGKRYVPNAATHIISQVLRRIPYDYLMVRPVVWCEEPYELRQVLSYCDTRTHQGTLYRASNFRLLRTNERGIQTYVRDLRHLTHAEHMAIRNASRLSERARRLRSEREEKRLQLQLNGLW